MQAACLLAVSNNVPVWFEPVSAPKASRATNILSLLDFISPNRAELISMATAYRQKQYGGKRILTTRKTSSIATSNGIQDVLSLHHEIATLLEAGVRNIVLTLGANGVALCRLDPHNYKKKSIDIYYYPALPCTVVNCSGAGDCLVAGFLFALLNKEDIDVALAYGAAAAKCAVESTRNVPEQFDISKFKSDALHCVDSVQKFQLPFMPLM